MSAAIASGSSQSSSTTVSMTVPSATNLSVSGCESGTADVTEFGTVLPGASAVTGADCQVIFGSSNDSSMVRAYQTDGGGGAMFGEFGTAIDTGFGTAGYTEGNASGSSERYYYVDPSPSGRIAAVGTQWTGENEGIVGVYDATGALDPGFNGGALIELNVGTNDIGRGVAVQDDGKVLAGLFYNNSPWESRIYRFNADGTPDGGFGTGGFRELAWGSNTNALQNFELLDDGSIIAAGFMWNGSDRIALAKLDASGNLDTTWQTNGYVTYDLAVGANEGLKDLTIAPDGDIIAVGYRENAGNDEALVVRFDADGNLDTSFDVTGWRADTTAGTGYDRWSNVELDADGNAVVFGFGDTAPSTSDLFLGSYTALGAINPGFNSGSFVQVDEFTAEMSYAPNEGFGGLVILPLGKIAAVSKGNNGGNDSVIIIRLNPDGTFDTEFDGDGVATLQPGGGDSDAWGAAFARDGQLAVAGRIAGGSGASIVMMDALTINDYVNTSFDWAGNGADLFGACLDSVNGGTTTATWTADPDTCTSVDTDPWNLIAVNSGGGTAKIAESGSAGETAGEVNLRFGLRFASNQVAGTYMAPITFEAVAPNV